MLLYIRVTFSQSAGENPAWRVLGLESRHTSATNAPVVLSGSLSPLASTCRHGRAGEPLQPGIQAALERTAQGGFLQAAPSPLRASVSAHAGAPGVLMPLPCPGRAFLHRPG